MSYLVLARKWRPHTFEEVIGQEHVTTTLENAIKSDRLASAYIFSGPRGVGKTTTARILAKALNCENGPTITPCNECSICKEITSGNSIDVLEIDGASNRGIDEIRNLRESTRYSSAQQRRKIYIIDEVHMLTTEAFNALLKTLEEPPPHVIFIFATTESNKVPATILSRTQRFDFRRIPIPKITEQLQKICAAENIKIDQRALYLIASKSEGCMRDSQSLLDQVISFCGMDIKDDEVADLLGVIGSEIYVEILDGIGTRDVKSILNISKTIYDRGYSFSQLLSGFAEHLNQVLVFKTTKSARFLDENSEFQSKFSEQADRFSELDLIRMYQAVVEAGNDLRWSQNPQLHVEMLLVRLTKIADSIELSMLLSEIDTLKKKALTNPAPAQEFQQTMRIVPQFIPQKREGGLFRQFNGAEKKDDSVSGNESDKVSDTTTKPTYSAPPTLVEIRHKWPEVISRIKKTKISIGSFLDEGKPASISGNQLNIEFAEENQFHIKTVMNDRVFIQGIIKEIMNCQIVINCTTHSSQVEAPVEHIVEVEQPVEIKRVVQDDSPRAYEPQRPAQSNKSKSTDSSWINDHPIAQKIIEAFEGEEID